MLRALFILVATGWLGWHGFHHAVQAQIIGDLTVINSDGKAVTLSEADIAALDPHAVRTRTMWTDGVITFEGVYLRDLLKAGGVDYQKSPDAVITAKALNDYTVAFPLSDAIRFDVLVALYQDGQRLTIIDKGPYWIVYPRDSVAELQDPRYDHRWAWQLHELTIQ
jgi:hypothetical protein